MFKILGVYISLLSSLAIQTSYYIFTKSLIASSKFFFIFWWVSKYTKFFELCIITLIYSHWCFCFLLFQHTFFSTTLPIIYLILSLHKVNFEWYKWVIFISKIFTCIFSFISFIFTFSPYFSLFSMHYSSYQVSLIYWYLRWLWGEIECEDKV